ncbi:MAG TPA: flavodoxin domain-containing protein, partial [Bacteroidales bacterium]|nr:flavodoxin domain-containing protein [Bacteroidales bacterium]
MAKIGIFYGSTTGNSEYVAQLIQAGFGKENAAIFNVGDAEAEDVSKYPYLIFGVSTWGTSDL